MSTKVTKSEQKRMFQLYCDGLSLKAIGREVNRCTDVVRRCVYTELAGMSERQCSAIIGKHKKLVKERVKETWRKAREASNNRHLVREVPPYRCEGCNLLVMLKPCQICAARSARKNKIAKEQHRHCKTIDLDYRLSEQENERREAIKAKASH